MKRAATAWTHANAATHGVRRRWRNAPRQLVYCVVGMLLGLAAPVVGLALAHAISESVFPTPAWLVADVAKLPTTYAYVVASATVAFAILGYLVGRWSDHLHHLSTTGVSHLDGTRSASLEGLLLAADSALYDAKETARVERADLRNAAVPVDAVSVPARCAGCGSDQHVQPWTGWRDLGFCFDCRERSAPHGSDDELGGSG